MPGLRPAPGLSEKIRCLPDLLSGVCIAWQVAWSGKIKLVGWQAGFWMLAAGFWLLAARHCRP